MSSTGRSEDPVKHMQPQGSEGNSLSDEASTALAAFKLKPARISEERQQMAATGFYSCC